MTKVWTVTSQRKHNVSVHSTHTETLFCAGEVQAFHEDLSGRQYINEVYKFGVDKMYDLLFTESEFMREFREHRRFSGKYIHSPSFLSTLRNTFNFQTFSCRCGESALEEGAGWKPDQRDPVHHRPEQSSGSKDSHSH